MSPSGFPEDPAKIDTSKLPSYIDVTANNITDHVHQSMANCPDERTKFIFMALIQHVHDFVRETALTTEELMKAIHFLTEVGQKCTEVRQEFMILSDTLGISTLVDIIDNAKPPGATETVVLGPFFTHDAHEVESGGTIASEGTKGDYLYVYGKVTDTKGNPIPGAIIETWESDGEGLYDVQHDARESPDCRGRVRAKADGTYSYRGVVPASYPIPGDGPAGMLVRALGRHIWRPAHIHMMVKAEGFEDLVSSVFLKGDKFLGSDVVFAAKSSLIRELKIVDDVEVTKARGFAQAVPHHELHHDFVLATPQEGKEARENLRSTWAK